MTTEQIKLYEMAKMKLTKTQRNAAMLAITEISLLEQKTKAEEEQLAIFDAAAIALSDVIKAQQLASAEVEKEYALLGLTNKERYVAIKQLELEKVGRTLTGEALAKYVAGLEEEYDKLRKIELVTQNRADYWLNQIDPMRQYIKQYEEIAELQKHGLLTPEQAACQ